MKSIDARAVQTDGQSNDDAMQDVPMSAACPPHPHRSWRRDVSPHSRIAASPAAAASFTESSHPPPFMIASSPSSHFVPVGVYGSYVPPAELTAVLSAHVLDVLSTAESGTLTLDQKIASLQRVLRDAEAEQAHTMQVHANATELVSQQAAGVRYINALQHQLAEKQHQQEHILQQLINQHHLQVRQQAQQQQDQHPVREQQQQLSTDPHEDRQPSRSSRKKKSLKSLGDESLLAPSFSVASISPPSPPRAAFVHPLKDVDAFVPSFGDLTEPMRSPSSPSARSANTSPRSNRSAASSPSRDGSSVQPNLSKIFLANCQYREHMTNHALNALPLTRRGVVSASLCSVLVRSMDTLQSYRADFEAGVISHAALQQRVNWLSSHLDAEDRATLIAEFKHLSSASTNTMGSSTLPSAHALEAVAAVATDSVAMQDELLLDIPRVASNSMAMSISHQDSALLPHVRLISTDEHLLSPASAEPDGLDGVALTMVLPSEGAMTQHRRLDDPDAIASSMQIEVAHPIHGILQVNQAWERLTEYTQDYMVSLTPGERPFKFMRADFVGQPMCTYTRCPTT
jgi:PAS domain-containing protein